MAQFFCVFIFVICLTPSYAADSREQSQPPAKQPITQEQPPPTPIHPCAPLEQCMPPSY